MSAAATGAERPMVGLLRQLPEPTRWWIAYRPRSWRGAAAPWTDLAGARLRGLHPPVDLYLPRLEAADFEDLCYLPPVAPELAAERDRLAAGLIESRAAVLLELAPGEALKVPGARAVYDLLRPLLAGDLKALSSLPAGSTAVWPLLPGLTDSSELWDEGCALLAAAGVGCVQALAVELTPADRRRLAEGREETIFDALFHRLPPPTRDFARCANRHGLAPFMARPPAGGSPRQMRNRRLAAELALAGEIWTQLDRSVHAGQGLLRAARRAESAPQDLIAVAREGNLGVIDWLDAQSLAVVEEIAEGGKSALLESLLEDYLSP